MDTRLQEMLDHFEIRKTLSEYCHGCDRGDELRMAGVYTQDSWDDHGSIKAPGPEFASVMMRTILSDTKALFHLLGQSLVKVNGNEAGAETYFFAVSKMTRDDGVLLCNQLGGRFVDKLVRENGAWKIKHRIAVRDWTISLPIEADWGAKALREGERSSADPSFEILGLTHSGESPR
jgi:hypothetical protein